MQENEFEKQLKDLMDEFKLVPSASVWEKVSRRLNEGKRKKRPFIFLWFFGLLVAGYFMYHYARQQPQTKHYTIKETNNSLKKDSLSLTNQGPLSSEKTTGQNSSTVRENENEYTAPKASSPKTNKLSKFVTEEKDGNQTNVISSNDNNNSSQQLIINPAISFNDVPAVTKQQLQNDAIRNQPIIASDSTKLINNTALDKALNEYHCAN
jgi:adenylate kinase family enzyme